MTEQLSLNLPYRTAYGREAFWVAPCNAQAVAWIDRYPNWSVPAVFIYGPAGSGKTHLVHLFTEEVIDGRTLTSDFRPPFQKKIAVENVYKLASEEALLHLVRWEFIVNSPYNATLFSSRFAITDGTGSKN